MSNLCQCQPLFLNKAPGCFLLFFFASCESHTFQLAHGSQHSDKQYPDRCCNFRGMVQQRRHGPARASAIASVLTAATPSWLGAAGESPAQPSRRWLHPLKAQISRFAKPLRSRHRSPEKSHRRQTQLPFCKADSD